MIHVEMAKFICKKSVQVNPKSMNKKIVFFSLLLIKCCLIHGQLHKPTGEKIVKQGMVITSDTKIKKGVYKLDASPDIEHPVILIDGYRITVDFNNITLQGSNSTKKPDEFFGVAIIVSSKSSNITIKNLKVKGYKVALFARDVTNLTVDNCDFSYNYRQHLNSTQEKEDISDWMSYHHNENDEWLRYGAAMYLRNCNLAIIRNCKVTGGQNALMMTNCNDGQVMNNDFSFNSGIGVGMYRCNYNEVAYNKIDFNVRGYSHGVYNRGQDSGGILVYEQSNHNLFYKNSVTHSGDGFFLWAGQTTMDSGGGGCNDNLILGNDFSYAPTNGVEVTFSRNKILKNRLFECDYGLWGGYSYGSTIAGNQFRNNNVGIAIEHGQDNDIYNNLFFRDRVAIKIWAKTDQSPDLVYTKVRDTKSKNYNLALNSFNENKTAIDLKATDSLKIFGNYFSHSDEFIKADSTVTNMDTTQDDVLVDRFSADTSILDTAFVNHIDPFKGRGMLNGRKNILMTEWGPYDFRSPIIWNTNPTDTSGTVSFDIKGPSGKWRLKSYKGVDSISAKSGNIPATITAKKLKTEGTDMDLQLEYVGEEIKTPLGETVAKGKPYTFSFKKFFQPIDWTVNWFSLDTTAYNPIKTGELFAPTVKMRPMKTEKTLKLDYSWWGGIKTDEGQLLQFITLAEGSANFQQGEYEIGVTWDDAVRVYIDNKLVIGEWNPSKYTFDEAPHKTIKLNLSAGIHQFRVEHIDLGGFATLALKIKKAE
jgi:parallel beta-helix repeat protein